MTTTKVEAKIVLDKPKVGETWVNVFTKENVVIYSVRNSTPFFVTYVCQDKTTDLRSLERFNQIFTKLQLTDK